MSKRAKTIAGRAISSMAQPTKATDNASALGDQLTDIQNRLMRLAREYPDYCGELHAINNTIGKMYRAITR